MSLSEFTSGAIFAGALMAAGVYEPSVIRSQMNFSSNAMITVMMGGKYARNVVNLLEKSPC